MAVAWGDTRYAPGEYVVRWDGDGELAFPLSTVRVASRAPGRIVLDVRDTRGPLWVGIEKTNPANPVRDVRFFWPGTEASAATQPFNPEFLRRLAPFSTLRFMDWGAVNHSPLVRWADRPQPGDAVYTSERGRPGRADDRPCERAAGRTVVLHSAPGRRRLRAPVRDLGEDAARSAPGRVDRVLERGLERLVRAGPLRGRAGARARPGDARPASARSGTPSARARSSRSSMRCSAAPSARAGAPSPPGRRCGTSSAATCSAGRTPPARVDAYAIAPYFHAAAANDPARVGATLALTPAQIVEQMRENIRGDVKAHITENAKLAARHKLPLLALRSRRERRQRGVRGRPAGRADRALQRAHRLPQMREVYREYVDTWVAGGGGLLNQYNDVGRWSKWGLWGVLEHVTQDPATSPKYQGLLDAIAAHPGAAALRGSALPLRNVLQVPRRQSAPDASVPPMTWSIIARDDDRRFGVAIASCFLAVGAWCPHTRRASVRSRRRPC
jgi:hypothetical protein